MVRTETLPVTVAAPQQFVSRTIPLLERKFDDALAAKPPSVDLVLSAVQIVDSASLNWLLSLQVRLESWGTRLRLVDLSPVMADVLLATRLDARLGVATATTGAEASLNPAGGVHGS